MPLAACTVIRLERGLHDWPLTLVSGRAALVLAGAFVVVERRCPFVRLGVLRQGPVVCAAVRLVAPDLSPASATPRRSSAVSSWPWSRPHPVPRRPTGR